MVRGADTEIQINKGDSPARVVSANRSAPAAVAAPTWSGTEPRWEAQARPPIDRSTSFCPPVVSSAREQQAHVLPWLAPSPHVFTREHAANKNQGEGTPGRGFIDDPSERFSAPGLSLGGCWRDLHPAPSAIDRFCARAGVSARPCPRSSANPTYLCRRAKRGRGHRRHAQASGWHRVGPVKCLRRAL